MKTNLYYFVIFYFASNLVVLCLFLHCLTVWGLRCRLRKQSTPSHPDSALVAQAGLPGDERRTVTVITGAAPQRAEQPTGSAAPVSRQPFEGTPRETRSTGMWAYQGSLSMHVREAAMLS